MADAHHTEVFFSGRVQGVGFRYAAFEIAREFEITGLVENLPDGRVHLEIEGRPEDAAAYLTALEERMHGHIRKVEKTARVRPGQFTNFAIR